MSSISISDDLRAELASGFRAVPISYRGVSLTKENILEFVESSFQNLSPASLKFFCEVLIENADKNGGAVNQKDLHSFLSDLREHSGQLEENFGNVNSEFDKEVIDQQQGFYDTITCNIRQDEVDMLRDAFIHMDVDSDGFVSLEEMFHVVKTVVGEEKFPALAEYLQPIFIVADKDGDGKLSLTEFLLSFAEGPGVVPTEVVNACVSSVRVRLSDAEIFTLQERFRKIDTNGDGYIDPDELLVGLKDALGSKFPDQSEATYMQILNVVMALADTDHDGRLSLSEFIRSFQEDQGVLPAVFIDSREHDEERPFTAAEEAIIEQVAIAAGSGPIERDVFLHILSQYIDDQERASALCDLLVSSSMSQDGRILINPKRSDIRFITVGDRIDTIKQRLFEVLREDELQVFSSVFSSIPSMGFQDVEVLSRTIHENLRHALPEREDDFISYLVQLVVSTGEITFEGENQLCSIDAFVESFGCENQNAQGAPTEGTNRAEGTSATIKTNLVSQVQKSVPSRPQTGYEGSPVRNDISGCPITDTQLRREFNMYDVNGNGYLDREEFKRIYLSLEHFGVEPSVTEVNELFTRYSRGKSHISYEEFTILMLHRSKM